MLSIQTVKEHRTSVEESVIARGQQEKIPLIDRALILDTEWRAAKGTLDNLRRERNVLSETINTKKKAKQDITALVQEAKALPERIKNQEDHTESLRNELDTILRTLPSPLDDETPRGAGEEENVQRKTYGTPVAHAFTPKSHVEILENLGLVDFDSARRVAGAGFFYLKGDLALLDNALQQYALTIMVEEGFTPIIPPHMTRHEIAAGMTDLAWFDETMFKIEGEDLYPIPTSEFPLVGILTGTDTDARQLPLTLCGISPCYRKELGAHGIDEKGLFRTHQFNKIEQVVVCAPEDSKAWFEKLLMITTRIFTGLDIPIRWLEMCSGDLGDLKSRMIDIEAWSPRRNGYIEVGSCSNLTDCQARRLGIRMVHPDGTRTYPHTLNNTALATSRAMVAIVENFQREDGTVDIPEALHPYMHGKTRLTRV